MESCIIPRMTSLHNKTKGQVEIRVLSNYTRIYRKRIDKGAILEVEADKFKSPFRGSNLIIAQLIGSENLATFEGHCFQTYSDLFFDVDSSGRLKVHGIKRPSILLPLYKFFRQLWWMPHNYLETQEQRKEEVVPIKSVKLVTQNMRTSNSTAGHREHKTPNSKAAVVFTS